MTVDFLFITAQPGLLMIDIPATSAFLTFAMGFWLVMYLVNLVLGIIKRLPFL